MGPCNHWPVKKPHFIKGVLEHGFNDFTTDTAAIDVCWDTVPDASIGMRLGVWHLRSQGGGIRVVRVIAVDIESKKGHDVDGFAGLKELEMKLGRLPHTWTNGTPSIGEHRFLTVTLSEGVELTNLEGNNALAPGVELKAKGQVLAPPSPGYWVKDKVPMAELPSAWLEAWVENPPRRSTAKMSAGIRGAPGPEGPSVRGCRRAGGTSS